MDNQKRCRRCKSVKTLSDFRLTTYKSGKQYYSSRCKSCSSEYTKEWFAKHLNNPNSAVVTTIQLLYLHSKGNAYNKKVPFNVTKDYLYELYNSQAGKCFYTGTQMKLKGVGSVKDPFYENSVRTEKIKPVEMEAAWLSN